MEGAGPPPMPTENIDQIPKVKITDGQAGNYRVPVPQWSIVLQKKIK
jgi:hypothetical protein